jgi:hypothetical protein
MQHVLQLHFNINSPFIEPPAYTPAQQHKAYREEKRAD